MELHTLSLAEPCCECEAVNKEAQLFKKTDCVLLYHGHSLVQTRDVHGNEIPVGMGL